ncbi:hypothetical protein QR680_015423 [Steinernema hermaphroditum]|uniref:Uncharacterized protein n=1 Tax=Steinernema hermaphroditum TaxID=289476 RepID=A0AA39LKS9_9BILA|nr:hypothetical protein QR680_015423 [Steinernema hermaphroditum]
MTKGIGSPSAQLDAGNYQQINDFITEVANAANRIHDINNQSATDREALNLGDMIRSTANRLNPRELALFRSRLFEIFDNAIPHNERD